MLKEYFEKDVQIKFTDGDVLSGHVVTYTPAIDSEDNVDEIGIKCDRGFISIAETEILTINLIVKGK